ncbi:DoxX family protein [Streptomyces sp. CBMA123]|uniref:DoxX family protein n=1 Tax=Streptomyces sp. CBMA123 TaxID=1896313 RepID=UPI001661BC84|nr:DoxX family protein [Streptomyces sp. CBMA123]MBD0694979.1 hypothetical protein [Streptomyces sp. CBMA123]
MAHLPRLISRLSRPLLATSFIVGGYGVLRAPGPLPELARQRGVPYPEAATRATAAGMIAGGVALGTGLAPVAGGALLVACLVPTTVAVHGFWRQPDPARRRAQRNEFLKNVSLLGGLVIAAVDARSTHPAPPVTLEGA